jgi:uncharacterized membrane protein
VYLSADGSASYLPWTSNSVELFYQMAGVVAGGLVVWLGIRNDWNEVINAGSFFFAVFLLVRLVDWWWDVVPTYLFFVLIGGIAIGLVAVFRRVRSRVRSVS